MEEEMFPKGGTIRQKDEKSILHRKFKSMCSSI